MSSHQIFPFFAEGFVVNIHDCVNYDIDLNLPPAASSYLSFINRSNYEYVPIGLPEYNSGISDDYLQQNVRIGSTFKCRLYGISLNGKNESKNLDIIMQCRRIIHNANSRVKCRVYSVDKYGRLMIDIETSDVISICSYLSRDSRIKRYR